jgi:hypothetical protein
VSRPRSARLRKGSGARGSETSHRRVEGASWLDGQFSPSFLFFWGLVLAPAVVLQDRLWLKAIQAAVLLALVAAAGRIHSRGFLPGSLLFVLATVGVNLLSPIGRLLLRLGPLQVTSGALAAGLRKALTLLALAYLSRLCVRRDLSLPGPAGRYLRLTFGYLNALLVRRPAMAGRDLIGRIDAVLQAVCGQEQGEREGVPRSNRTTAAGLAMMTAGAGLMWFPVVWRF